MTIDEAKEWLHKEVPTEILLERIYEEFKLELEAEYKKGWEDRHTQSHFESRNCEGCKWNYEVENRDEDGNILDSIFPSVCYMCSRNHYDKWEQK